MTDHPGAWQNTAWYEVAAFHPTAGEADPSGGRTYHTTYAAAMREVERTRSLGFKDVHVRKVTIARIRAPEGL